MLCRMETVRVTQGAALGSDCTVWFNLAVSLSPYPAHQLLISKARGIWASYFLQLPLGNQRNLCESPSHRKDLWPLSFKARSHFFGEELIYLEEESCVFLGLACLLKPVFLRKSSRFGSES